MTFGDASSTSTSGNIYFNMIRSHAQENVENDGIF